MKLVIDTHDKLQVVLSNNAKVKLTRELENPEDVFMCCYVRNYREKVDIKTELTGGGFEASSFKGLLHDVAGYLIRDGKAHLVPNWYRERYADLTRLNPHLFKRWKNEKA